MDLKLVICIIFDYFKLGIMFCDVMMFIGDVWVFWVVVDQMVQFWVGVKIDMVVGIEVCGFILGGVVVYQFLVGFMLVCKKGKLFYCIIVEDYELEYGIDMIEIYVDVIKEGDCVLLVDDLIVIGGIVEVLIKFFQCVGVIVVGVVFVIDFLDLGGVKCIEVMGVLVFLFVEYEGDQGLICF